MSNQDETLLETTSYHFSKPLDLKSLHEKAAARQKNMSPSIGSLEEYWEEYDELLDNEILDDAIPIKVTI